MRMSDVFGRVCATAAMLAVLCVSTVRAEDGFPLSGQNTVYEAERPGFTLVTRKRVNFAPEHGRPYRLRFSNESRSFHIMPGDGTSHEFKVNGGFPGGNLKDIELDGALFGNPGIRISKHQAWETLDARQYDRSYSCTYVCGQDYVCRDVVEQRCSTYTEPGRCYTERTENCYFDRFGRRICTPQFRQVCSPPVTRTRCEPYTRRSCGLETRFCNGNETWRVEDVTRQEVLRMKILDSQAGELIGTFRGVLDSKSDTRKLQLLNTTCR